MLRFKNLGSGSTGNATVVEGRSGSQVRRLLIDCGLGIRQLQARLAQAQLQVEDLDALFITHEHSDHIGCAQTLALRFRIPVWMSEGTYAALGAPGLDGLLRVAHDMEAIDMGAFEARPLTVPHELVVDLGLLPVERTQAPAGQRVAFQFLEATLHLFLGQVEPELEDQCAFIAEHLLQALGAVDRLVQAWVLDLAMDPALQHLAVPVAEEHAGAPLGRQDRKSVV